MRKNTFQRRLSWALSIFRSRPCAHDWIGNGPCPQKAFYMSGKLKAMCVVFHQILFLFFSTCDEFDTAKESKSRPANEVLIRGPLALAAPCARLGE